MIHKNRLNRRYVREKAIARKKAICHHRGFDWYANDGQYSKGKVHCGCAICSYSKYYDLPRLSDIKANDIERSYAL